MIDTTRAPLIIIVGLALASSTSLDDTVSRLRAKYARKGLLDHSLPYTVNGEREMADHAKAEALVRQWSRYESEAAGTGLHPQTPDIGPGYGPGLGDVAVRTGLGVRTPYTDFTYRRDFELGMGGSGRSGGQPFGWGNGMGGLAASPWAG